LLFDGSSKMRKAHQEQAYPSYILKRYMNIAAGNNARSDIIMPRRRDAPRRSSPP